MPRNATVFVIMAFLLSGCVPRAGDADPDQLLPVTPTSLSLEGEFTYMADAALFKECLSGQTYPVAMEAGYLTLERAYLDIRSEPGAPVYVTISGSIVERPAMEGEPRNHVVVEALNSVSRSQRCEE